MKLHLIAVGHRMPAWVNAGYEEYARRMPRQARLVLTEIKPEKRDSGRTIERVLTVEAVRLEAAFPDGAETIALDEGGEPMSTRQIADWLARFMAEGRDAAFLIGSADGLHPRIKERARRLLSLSSLTLPHGLARVLLAEQLYRAMSLIRSHPYHRE